MRFLLGGNDLSTYPGFNGQFTRPTLKVGPGAHLKEQADLQKYALSCNPKPSPDCKKAGTVAVMKESKIFQVDDRPIDEFVSPTEYAFPEEYAVQGWFKWAKP